MQNAVLVEHLKSIEASVKLIRLVGEDDLAAAVRRMEKKVATAFWLVWMIGASCVLLDEMAKLGFPINLRHEGTGATALHCAASRGNAEMVKLLLQSGADICARDVLDGTPLHDAVRRRHPEAVAALIEAGADVNATCRSGNYTPLFFVAYDEADGPAKDIAALLKGAGAAA